MFQSTIQILHLWENGFVFYRENKNIEGKPIIDNEGTIFITLKIFLWNSLIIISNLNFK